MAVNGLAAKVGMDSATEKGLKGAIAGLRRSWRNYPGQGLFMTAVWSAGGAFLYSWTVGQVQEVEYTKELRKLDENQLIEELSRINNEVAVRADNINSAQAKLISIEQN